MVSTYKKKLSLGIALLLLVSCDYFKSQPVEDPIAKVGESYLVLSDIDKIIPENISVQDSTILANNYIQDWAQQQLMLSRAKLNIPEIKQKEFEDLVKQYRADLFINAYKEGLVAKSMDTQVSHMELETYYEDHKENFKLNERLVKIRYINVANQYDDIKQLREAIRRFNQEDKDLLNSLAITFKSYSLNDSTWVKSSSIIQKLPKINIENSGSYLKKSHFFELSDSLGVYLVTVNEVLERNDIAPLEYVEPTVRKIILNKRKLDFIKKLERELLDEATGNKEFEIFDLKQDSRK
ncbi:peptidyl-prolyl cis-trans isomerase [Galbibacter sp.]|jgi:hypothetical protein|uniref:peptidyl-prolyl cis-trans isomerase n=1 Tax=Galbibacter sp. TaxID=2918471 RepID=UPI003A91953B